MEEIDAWIGLDVGKTDHHATVINPAGDTLLTRGVLNDEKAIERLLDDAGPRAWSISPARSARSPSPSRGVAVSVSPTCRARDATRLRDLPR